jgi:hypothetical protein
VGLVAPGRVECSLAPGDGAVVQEGEPRRAPEWRAAGRRAGRSGPGHAGRLRAGRTLDGGAAWGVSAHPKSGPPPWTRNRSPRMRGEEVAQPLPPETALKKPFPLQVLPPLTALRNRPPPPNPQPPKRPQEGGAVPRRRRHAAPPQVARAACARRLRGPPRSEVPRRRRRASEEPPNSLILTRVPCNFPPFPPTAPCARTCTCWSSSTPWRRPLTVR